MRTHAPEQITQTTNGTVVGMPLPPFSLPAIVPDESGAREKVLTNETLRGRPHILFFYPKDATCDCTVEACEFRDAYAEFLALEFAVIGVSRDSIGAHKKFIAAQKLPFPLISDKERTLIEGLNLLVHTTMYGKPVTKVLRHTFVVDANGIVRHEFAKVKSLGHARQVLDWLREQEVNTEGYNG